MSNPFQVVRDFEQALCEYTGAPFAVTTTSCTMALLLAVAWHLSRGTVYWARERTVGEIDQWVRKHGNRSEIEIPKRTYVGVAYAIKEAGAEVTFRDDDWRGMYQLRPLPVFDSARWLTAGIYNGATVLESSESAKRLGILRAIPGTMICVSFHWSKTLGIQQGGAILHDSLEADVWLRRARFDGRMEGVPPSQDAFPIARAWHAYMSPETAAAGLVRLANLPRNNDPIPADDYPDLSKLDIFR